jgi:Dolichyl-phosphate-mannose-protein mannosyltransferase
VTSRRKLFWLLNILFLLAGLTLLALAILPYNLLKSLADSLMADGEFESLNAGNAVVFKVVFGMSGLAFFALAAATFFHCWLSVSCFLKQLWADTRRSLRSLRIPKSELPFLALVLVLMAVAVVYRLEFLYSSLHHDEAYTYMAFAHSLRTAVTDYHLPNNHVFHSILVYCSTRLFGNQPWVVRLPAFVAGVLLVPAIYAVGKRHYDRWVGLAAALLVATAPSLIHYSDNARGYTLVALFGLLLLLFGYTVRSGKNRFAWVLIGLVSALGMYTVPVFLFPFGVAYLWLFLENWLFSAPGYASRRDFLKYWLASGFGAAGLTLFLYLPILVYTGPEKLFGNAFVSPVPWPDFLETLSHRLAETWADWTFRVPLAVILLLAAGWALGLLFHKKISPTRVPLQLAAALWILILLLLQRPNAWTKVWVFLQPLMLLWAAAGIFGLLGLVKIRGIRLSALAVVLLLAMEIWHSDRLIPQLPNLWAIHGNEENAVLFVKNQLQSDDKLVVSPPDDASVWYYAELHGIYDSVYQHDSAFDRLFVLVNPDEGQTPDMVLTERGPGVAAVAGCSFLEVFGKIEVVECMRH